MNVYGTAKRAFEQELINELEYSVVFRLSNIIGIGGNKFLDFLLAKILVKKEDIKELILATSTTIEGEATAHYIQKICQDLEIKVSRIAFGIPLNGELGYLDGETISHAFNERKEL